MATAIETADDDQFWIVATRILAGKVVPFLGAGANLCGRPEGAKFELGKYLPSGQELAEVLAEPIRFPVSDDPDAHLDLLQVSQYVDAILGPGVLYEFLRQTFNADYPPTALHHLLAVLPGLLRQRSVQAPLILTTNYDDALERAFDARGERYDLLWYEAKKGSTCGRFIHRTETGPVTIERPNEYDGLTGECTVVVKLHGAIDRTSAAGDSYVITEDNYIDYLTRSDISSQIPATVKQRMAESHFLFLGYSLRDWNLRVILQRIWGAQKLPVRSWAIQRAQSNPKLGDIERKLWRDRGEVDVVYMLLDEYVTRLRASLAAVANVELAP